MQQTAPSYISTPLVAASDIVQGLNYGSTVFLSSNSSSQYAYPGASGANNAALACRTGPLIKGITGSSYYSFSISASSGSKFLLQTLQVGLRSTFTGPQSWSLFSSIDNFSTPIVSGSLVNNSSWHFQTLTLNTVYQTTVEYRLYGFDGVGVAAINIANWRIDDLQITGLVVPASLPVVWLYTHVSQVGSAVKVEWATTREENNYRFYVERSKDGHLFSTIGELKPHSNLGSTVQQVYEFWDYTPLQGRTFYRIAQQDLDGTLTHGTIKSIFLSAIQSFSIVGSVIDFSSCQLRLLCRGSGQTTFKVLALSGQLLTQETRMLVSGQLNITSIQIPSVGINKMNLLLVVLQGNKIVLSKIIVSN